MANCKVLAVACFLSSCLAFPVMAKGLASNDPLLLQINQKLLHSPNDFALWDQKSRRLGQLKLFSEELALAKEMVVRFPNKRASQFSLMQAHQGLGNHRDALVAFQKMSELAPLADSDYIIRSDLYAQNGRFKDSLNDANRALAIFPNDAGLYFVRARCNYRLKGPCRESVQDLEKFLQLNGPNPEVQQLLAKIKNGLPNPNP